MNIFVGNLSFASTQDDVKKLFEGFGNVASVVIVMSKEKKTPKSRGFGFVEMPDEQQALAAIAALSRKEFMGRVLNVDPARPRVQKAMVRPPTEENKIPNRKPGTYRSGRRTHSYMKRRGLAGISDEVKPRRESRDNPMRWRKREDQPRPWQKSSGEHKPWKKPAGGAKPWSKSSERTQEYKFKGKGRKKPGRYKR